jgi:DNA-binding protein YbaB
MFDQIKDLYNLKKQAAEMEKMLAAETVTGSSKDQSITIVITGKHDVQNVEISDTAILNREDLARAFKEAYSDAQSKLEKVLMQKFKGMM